LFPPSTIIYFYCLQIYVDYDAPPAAPKEGQRGISLLPLNIDKTDTVGLRDHRGLAYNMKVPNFVKLDAR
jgi:hypothetical protein